MCLLRSILQQQVATVMHLTRVLYTNSSDACPNLPQSGDTLFTTSDGHIVDNMQ